MRPVITFKTQYLFLKLSKDVLKNYSGIYSEAKYIYRGFKFRFFFPLLEDS